MAWPGNFNWNHYGSGVDHAPHNPPPPPPPPPPPHEMGPFGNPEFWQRCFEERRGWEDWNPEYPQGPHGRSHSHGFGRRGGRRHGGRHPHGPDADGHHGPATDNEDFPPEYIDDEEVAEAVADGEKEKERERDGADSPDTMMREDTPTSDPPEGVPSDDEGRRHRGHGCHGRRGSFGRRGRGGFGPHGRGDHRRHGSGPRGFHHRGHPPPPPPPFFGGMFGGGPRGPHGPPPPPFFEALFGGGPGPRGGPGGPGGPHGRHPHGPPPPAFFEGLFGGGPGPRGGPGGPGSPHGPPPPPPPEGPAGTRSPFDFRPWMAMLASHPFAQNLREYLERAQDRSRDGAGEVSGDDMDGASFTPPLDLFEQPDRWVLHMAVPGAKKEDVGVSWDADRSVLSVSGVVHRPGDEEFLKGLISGERSTGLFSREVRLPPTEGGRQESGKEEVNAEGIEAKMEDGILIVTVPKIERGWTEVKKVDIQ
ncbi:hypothetical protein VM1G_01462 [Cytospora mali]|uniref:SHSP domain-containing protein n=1 Tax=Cytospora mali TaxID=578113 RepID=A0A194VRF4_CYTMA|nr:hypothetical protein VM1G_01462 [Valsa mali]